jgi:hypothetical protein
MATKLSAPIGAFAVVLGLATLAGPALAQTAYGEGYGAPQTSFTVAPRYEDGVRAAPAFRGDNSAFYYGGARNYANPVATPHSAAGTGGGEGGESGSGAATEGPRE